MKSAFFQLLKLIAHCKDLKNVTHVYPQFIYMIFLYIHVQNGIYLLNLQSLYFTEKEEEETFRMEMSGFLNELGKVKTLFLFLNS